MKRRYVYMIAFGVPGLAVALIAGVWAVGAAAGALWIFVFGDNPWPPLVDWLLPLVFGVTFLLLWGVLLAAGYLIGKSEEERRQEITGDEHRSRGIE